MAIRILISIALIAGMMTLAACSSRSRTKTVVVVAPSGHGPPPHAPAHGYRHKHGGADLVFDSGLQVYVVAGKAGLYYSSGHYYRHHGGHWQLSAHSGGPWKKATHAKLPKKLKKLKHKRSKRH